MCDAQPPPKKLLRALSHHHNHYGFDLQASKKSSQGKVSDKHSLQKSTSRDSVATRKSGRSPYKKSLPRGLPIRGRSCSNPQLLRGQQAPSCEQLVERCREVLATYQLQCEGLLKENKRLKLEAEKQAGEKNEKKKKYKLKW